MKVCPRCQKTYTDDNLNFCLDDGVVLQQAGGAEAPPTVFMNQPPATDPRAAMQAPPTMQSQQPAWNTAPQPQYGGPPKKSSRTWIWVLLILGVVVIGCGTLSVVGIILINKSTENSAVNTTTATTNTKTTANTKVSNTSPANTTFPSNTSSTTTTTAPTDGRTDVEDIDMEGWVKDTSLVGNTEFTNGEFIMSSKEKGYYYVLVAPETYTSDGADIRVSLRNMDNMDSRYGYGLIFHSNPKPLVQDYAFLIDTKKKKYRVVRHLPSDEKTIIPWTNSNAIKDGTQENNLEARDKPSDGKIDLYINGQLVNTIPNTYGYKGGVPGLYAGDAAKIAFKNLQLVK